MASEHKCDLIDLEMYLLVESPNLTESEGHLTAGWASL
jgi:hypothetical protein